MCSTIIGDVLHFPFTAFDGAGDSSKIGVGVGVGIGVPLLLLLLLVTIVVVVCVHRQRKKKCGTCMYVNLCMLIT